MKFLMRVFLFLALVLVCCGIVLTLAVGSIPLEKAENFLQLFYADDSLRTALVAIAVLIAGLSLIINRWINGGNKKDNVIAFDNPSGRVTLSVVALEDLVKRLTFRISEVKDVKADIFAVKEGIQVKMKLALCSDVSIPEITSQVQEMVKSKIQDTIGIEDNVNVEIHVGKILSERGKKQSAVVSTKVEEDAGTNVPFQGYRA